MAIVNIDLEKFIDITDTLWDKYSSQDYHSNMTITEHNYDYLIEELVEKLIASNIINTLNE